MPDPHLYDLMHEVHTSKKLKTPSSGSDNNQFDRAINFIIKKTVDEKMIDVKPSNRLLPDHILRIKLEKEERESIELVELERHIFLAISIILTECHKYLSEKEAHLLLEEMHALKIKLNQFTENALDNEKFKCLVNFCSENIDSICKIGLAKDHLNLQSDSLSIFAFLTILNPENATHWYRLGLMAQKNQYLELALRAYDVAGPMSPDFIGIPIFATQCCLGLSLPTHARAYLQQAKQIAFSTNVEEHWQKLLADLDNLVQLEAVKS